jgi:hypothetical protein
MVWAGLGTFLTVGYPGRWEVSTYIAEKSVFLR